MSDPEVGKKLAPPLSVVLLAILVVFISGLALRGIFSKELFLFSMLLLMMFILVSYVNRHKVSFVFFLVIMYLSLSLAWQFISGFSSLPRDDIYHYYPFTKYIYVTDRFASPNVPVSELEQTFTGIVASWPLWHILIVSLSKVSGLNLLLATQLIQPSSTVLLIILMGFSFAIIISKNNVVARVLSYLLPVILLFNNSMIYSNVNPVPRSYVAVLFIVLTYLLLKMFFEGRRYALHYLAMSLIILSALTFSHPYYSLAIPSIIVLYILLLSFTFIGLSRFKEIVPKAKSFVHGILQTFYPRTLILLAIANISSSMVWILYHTYSVSQNLAKTMKYLLDPTKWYLLDVKLTSAWLQTSLLQKEILKVNPIEHIASNIIWSTDVLLIIGSLAALTYLAVFVLLKGKCIDDRLCKSILLLVLLLVSSTIMTIITGKASAGTVTRYVFSLIATPASILTAASITLLYLKLNSINIRVSGARIIRYIGSLIVISIMILYMVSATLGLGTRTYQASFLWSNDISLEDKGMHTTRARYIAAFYNEFYDNRSGPILVLSDDSAIRVFLDTSIFMYLSHHLNTMIPVSFIYLSKMLDEYHRVILFSLRDLKPTYWLLRTISYKGLSLEKIINDVRRIVHEYGDKIYDNGFSSLYYIAK